MAHSWRLTVCHGSRSEREAAGDIVSIVQSREICILVLNALNFFSLGPPAYGLVLFEFNVVPPILINPV